MKEEMFYSRDDKSENYTMAELKTKIWRYYMSYWANRHICTANGDCRLLLRECTSTKEQLLLPEFFSKKCVKFY